jgi:hypothetical protein
VIIIDEKLLDYFRDKRICELCGRRIPWKEKAHPHHVQARGHGGGSRLDVALNVLGACWQCHSDAGTPEGKEQCLEVVAYREGLLVEQVQEAIWRLLRRDK